MSLEPDDSVALLDELPEAFLIVTESGKVLFTNRAFSQLTDYRQDELLETDISKLLPTPERRRVQVIEWFERWSKDTNSPQLKYLNLELVKKSQARILVSIRVSKHTIKAGPCFLVVFRDVTTQHETLSALRHAQLITNRILAIGSDAIISIDADQKLIYWNNQAQQLFGYSEPEIIGKHLSILIPAEKHTDHSKLVQNFAANSLASKMMAERDEIYGLHKDGRRIPLEASITKTTIDGQIVLSAQIRDISARKERQRALIESEARFKAIFDNTLEAMLLLTPSGEILEINPAASALLPNPDAKAVIWKLDWWNEKLDPLVIQQRRDTLKESVRRCRAGEVIRATTTLGGKMEIDFSMLPVNGINGVVNYIIAEAHILFLQGQHD